MKKITFPTLIKYFSFAIFIFFAQIVTAQSSEVVVSINWPQWSGDNSFENLQSLIKKITWKKLKLVN